MSILKKLIATAGVFALASASLVSTPISAGTLNLQNATLPAGHILCVVKTGNLTTSGTSVSSGASLSASVNGEEYQIYLVNSSSCSLSNSTNTSALGTNTFFAYQNHNTQLSLGTITAATTNPAAAPVLAISKSYDNTVPKYTDLNTINICLGDSRSYDVTIKDENNDVLTNSGANITAIGSNAFVSSVNGAGYFTYKVQPTTQAYSTLNNEFTLAYSVKEEDLSPAANNPVVTPTFGSAVTGNVKFKTVDSANCTPVTTTSSSKSSSSMSSMSSSSMSSSSATPVASTVAASSKAPVTEVAAAPMADSAKGSTVRTGGNN
jgi:hypothetical protein